MFSALHPEADIRRAGCDFRVVPTAEVKPGQPLIEKRLANCTN
jgi:hypothetical protein